MLLSGWVGGLCELILSNAPVLCKLVIRSVMPVGWPYVPCKLFGYIDLTYLAVLCKFVG